MRPKWNKRLNGEKGQKTASFPGKNVNFVKGFYRKIWN